MKLNKKQKRTATIASMAALLAVVLGMGGQTFAKYVTTTTTASKQATVAQWGVIITADANDMFGTDYTAGVSVDTTGAGVSAAGVAPGDVVAPGTKGTTNVTIEGVPEVSSKVSFVVTGTPIGIYEGSTIKYEPIRWSVTKTGDNGTDGLTNVTFAELQTYFTNEADEYAPNESLVVNYEISWKWAFDSTKADGDHIIDENDTKLGNIVAGKVTDADDIVKFTFGITIKVEQTEK